nr:MAG TPA: hypothetical protein [Caudoviricetes sp.]
MTLPPRLRIFPKQRRDSRLWLSLFVCKEREGQR